MQIAGGPGEGEGFEVGQHEPFKRLHYHRCLSSRSVVIKSYNPGFLGLGIMVEVLKQARTWHISSEVLEMFVNTGDS